MKIDRPFVRHRNDAGIPDYREIKVIENDAHHLRNYPVVSVIIPTCDGIRNGYFKMLLWQLRDQTFQNFEIIVIKGDSRQGRAINSGVDISRGKYILTLDDDTSLQNFESIKRLVEVLEKDRAIGLAGGINVVPKNTSFFIKRAMEEIPRRKTPPVECITDSDLAEHPLLIMRKADFMEIGGENELIPRGLDPYLRNQYRKAKFRIVVVPEAQYSHLPPDNMLRLIKQFYRNGLQAAFCNKFYPQWVIETPSDHVTKFSARRPFQYRVKRYILTMLKKILKGHWVYLTAYTGYSVGFMCGYLQQKDNSHI